MQCPICKLYNPDDAMRCDCGYDFDTHEVKETFLSEKTKTPSQSYFSFGWIFSFLGGFIGIFVAYSIAFGKNKEGYTYDPISRQTGKKMFVFSIIMFIFWVVVYGLIKNPV